jgi:hypothetical protein
MDRMNSFALEPMSAGDIIDRAVRIYKKQFLPLIRLVLPPGLLAYAGMVAMIFGAQNAALERGDARLVMSILLMVAGFILWTVGKIAFYVVLGGTSRALVNYFLDGTPPRPMEVYREIRGRFWSLLGATLLVLLMLMASLSLLYVVGVMGISIYILGAAFVLSQIPFALQVICHVIFGVLMALGLIGLGLLIFKRVIFIPQALMIEGRGVFNAIGRSFSLAGSDIRQVGAIVLFNSCVTWSVLMLLMVPLVWTGYVNGVGLNPFDEQKPFWYSVSQQTISQLSEILLMPVMMLGFTLMYLDARIKREGFDVDLLAGRRLAPLPANAQMSVSMPTPEPAIAPVPSILGLSDYRPRGNFWPTPLSETAPEATSEIASDTKADTDPASSETESPQPAQENMSASTVPVQPGAAVVRVCTRCGASIFDPESADRFCRICGTLFDSPESPGSSVTTGAASFHHEKESGEVFPVAHD